MPTPNNSQLITYEGWTLRVRPARSGPPRLFLLIHGWTGSEDSMWVFARNFAQDFWLVAPRAPYLTQPSGSSWRPPQTGSKYPPRLQDLQPAADALIALVDSYAGKNGIAGDRFDVMGFSQGAALSNALALLHPDRIRRVGILSGFMPLESEALIEKRPLIGIPFFVAHGTQDELVRIEDARRSMQLLEQAGAQVTYCEDQVGHKVSLNCMRALERFFV